MAFSIWSVLRSYNQSSWSNEFSSVLQGRLRTDGNIIKLRVNFLGYSPASNDVSTEAEESPLLGAINKQQLVKAMWAEEDLACSDL
jgi:hypothetical protein